MYLEIKDLTEKEKEIIKEVFGDRARHIYSIYHEICRVEADCSLERVLDELGIEIDMDKFNKAIEEISEEIAHACEDNAFQEMCEIADQISREYFTEEQ